MSECLGNLPRPNYLFLTLGYRAMRTKKVKKAKKNPSSRTRNVDWHFVSITPIKFHENYPL